MVGPSATKPGSLIWGNMGEEGMGKPHRIKSKTHQREDELLVSQQPSPAARAGTDVLTSSSLGSCSGQVAHRLWSSGAHVAWATDEPSSMPRLVQH